MMRLPKQIIICNRPWKVIKTNKHSTAKFSYHTMTIEIGTKKNTDLELFTMFLHEITEISAVERGIRAEKCVLQHEANDFVFCASHKDFDFMVKDVAQVLSKIFKIS